MDISSKYQEIKARFLLLAGPLFISFILFAISLRQGTTPLILPITALGGLVACYLWKWRGVALSSLTLIGALALSLHAMHNHHWVWVIALALTIACTFVVTVLCAEESYREIEVSSEGENDPRQVINKLNDQLQIMQKQHASDLQEYTSHIDQLKQDLLAKDDKIRSNDHLIKLVRDEMSATYSHQEKLMQELFQARQQLVRIEGVIGKDADSFIADQANTAALDEAQQKNVSLREELESVNQLIRQMQQKSHETEIHYTSRLAETTESARLDYQKLLDEKNQMLAAVERLKADEKLHGESLGLLKQQLQAAETEKRDVDAKLTHAESALSKKAEEVAEELRLAHERFNSDKSRLQLELETTKANESVAAKEAVEAKSALKHLSETENKLKEECSRLQQERQLLQDKLNEAEHKLTIAPEPVIADDRELRRIEAMYQQLKQQFNEKSEVLTATRRELFFKEEQLLALQKDFDESILAKELEAGFAVEKALSQAEKELLVEHDWQQAEISHLHELIEMLNVKIASK